MVEREIDEHHLLRALATTHGASDVGDQLIAPFVITNKR
jgi:hypothetical protein